MDVVTPTKITPINTNYLLLKTDHKTQEKKLRKIVKDNCEFENLFIILYGEAERWRKVEKSQVTTEKCKVDSRERSDHS